MSFFPGGLEGYLSKKGCLQARRGENFVVELLSLFVLPERITFGYRLSGCRSKLSRYKNRRDVE